MSNFLNWLTRNCVGVFLLGVKHWWLLVFVVNLVVVEIPTTFIILGFKIMFSIFFGLGGGVGSVCDIIYLVKVKLELTKH